MTPSNGPEKMTNGAAWAAILAAGLGCFALGVLIDLGEGTKFFSKALNFYDPVGNLSGKTTVGIFFWLIAWAILHARWKNQTIQATGKIMALTLVLVLLAIIASCPLFFGLFSAG
jgi:hypothetical protein